MRSRNSRSASTERAKVRETLKTIHDIERLVARAALGTAGPRDLVSLRQSIAAIPRVRMLLSEMQAPLVRSLLAEIDDLADIRDELDATLLDEPPAVARDGGMIRDGVDRELDELRTISRSRQAAHRRDGRGRARAHRHQLPEDPLQPGLRVLHRDLEVESRQRAPRLPPQADDRRRRTLHHAGVEGVRGKSRSAPTSGSSSARSGIFEALRGRVAAEAPRIQDTARGIAALDVLSALAETAAVCNYTKPLMHAGEELSPPTRGIRSSSDSRRTRSCRTT